MPVLIPCPARWLQPVILFAVVLLAILGGQHLSFTPAIAQAATCRFPASAAAQKREYLRRAVAGDRDAQSRYAAIVAQHAQQLQQCRSQAWPAQQGIWMRLYPCDARVGGVEDVLDRIVNLGYNEVYIEVFYSGQVLLPRNNNPTPWIPVLRNAGLENRDLLAEAIQKGRDRGLKVYAWLFTMNFGQTYARVPGRQAAIARNGRGQTSLEVAHAASFGIDINSINTEELFIDPYSPIARADYIRLVEAVAQRRPDGVLFDYIRYPKGRGSNSIATRATDLWIYSEASRQALYNRALNEKGYALIQRFLSQGYITQNDIDTVDKQYPYELEPMWHGRSPMNIRPLPPAAVRQPVLQQELWYLAVAHAVQGVVDFLHTAIDPLLRARITSGVVFFPDGNQVIGQGYDSRLQAWERFPAFMEWHPMAYATCNDARCIIDQVLRVLANAPQGTQVKPVLAGAWGQSVRNRPPLESQMQALRQTVPQLRGVSHFAYSWQEPEVDRQRRSCRL
ncbi:MAG: family 10 glycosylhydrolase [Cyanobacteria bacterium]|nr:family 10 glycosylhydrolase [Cyanobacteriota bacterium]